MNRFIRTLIWIAAGAAAGVGFHHLTKGRQQKETPVEVLRRSGTRTIETERLVLRRFTMEDAQAVYDNWANNPEVTRFLQWKPHQDVDETEGILADWISRYDDGGWYNWAIELKERGEPIGNISVVQQDERARRAHIGYCIGKQWWHQGIMTEALSAVIKYLFSEGYLRIDSRHNVNNPHSGDVMKKCGMQYEGTFKGYEYDNSGIGDASFYAILKEDYDKNQGGACQ